MKFLVSALLMTFLLASASGAARIEVVLHEPAQPVKIDPRLFGQFLERTGGDGNGAEQASHGTKSFSPLLIDYIQRMKIPVIRFPGGTTVDEVDWTDMIDHVPGREGPRPITHFEGGQKSTNQFGYDEYFALRDQLHCQTLLVLNVLDAFAKRKPLEQQATKSVGLLAYTNAPVGAKLPDGMPDWPAVRAANGHREPFHADYVQIGNEWFVASFKDAVAKGTGLKEPADIAAWYIECLKSYITKIREIDPQIPIIIDGVMGVGVTARVFADPFIKANVRYATFHSYGPGGVDKLSKNGAPFLGSEMTQEDWWNMLVSVPGEFSPTGESLALGTRADVIHDLGYHIIITEWNWNGFGFGQASKIDFNHKLTAALGAAGFLNGLLRQAGMIDLATQSNLVGSWEIGAVLGDYADPKGKLYYSPTAQATNFYNLHHGDHLLESDVKGDSTFTVSAYGTWSRPRTAPVAYVDMVATASPDTLYLHIVNRHRNEAVPIHLDASAIGLVKGRGFQHQLTGSSGSTGTKVAGPLMREESKPVEISNNSVDATIPPASIVILELPRKSKP